jgi:transcriptional regulator with XRE-family HTH domain
MTVPNIPRLQLGHSLREHREARGITQAELGQAFESHGPKAAAKISRIEGGKIGCSDGDLRAMCKLLKLAPEEWDELLAWNRQGSATPWWAKYKDVLLDPYLEFIAYEWSASRVTSVQTDMVFGLLQTEDYMDQLSNALPFIPRDPDVYKRVRLHRQERLLGDNPPEVEVFLLERVVRKMRFGTREMFAEQLRKLEYAAELPNVELRIISDNAPIFIPYSLDLVEVSGLDVLVSEGGHYGGVHHIDGSNLQFFNEIVRTARQYALSSEASKQLISEGIKEFS